MATKKKTAAGPADAMAIEQALSELRAALETTDLGAWLSTALATWRVIPAAEVSLLVEKISEHLHEADKPIGVSAGDAREAAWAEIAGRKDPADLARLLATPWPDRWPQALDRLVCLDALPPDPRVAMAYVRLVDAMPYTSGLSSKFWSALTQLLARFRDPRAAEAFAEVAAKPTRFSHPHRILGMFARTVAVMRRHTAQLPPEGEDAIVGAIAQLDAQPLASRVKAKSEAEFLAEIYARPDDVALREVYGDWLLERGDPRGEFTALQLERARTGTLNDVNAAREAELFKALRSRLCGRLDPVTTGCEPADFDRGFLARGTLEMGDAMAAMLVGAGEWSTVREVWLSTSFRSGGVSGPTIARLFVAPPMQSLREVHMLPPESARVLCARNALPRLEEISILCDYDGVRGIDISSTLEPPASVKRVGVVAYGSRFDAWLFNAPFWHSAEHVWLRCYAAQTYLDAILPRCGRRLRSFELGGCGGRKLGGWGFEYRRDEAGLFSRIEIRWGPLSARDRLSRAIPGLLDVLEKVPRELPREIVLAVAAQPRLAAPARASIEEALERFPNLTHRELPWDPPVART